MDRHDDESLREMARVRMQQKETEELLIIWKQKDREEWTDTALDVVEEILIDRLGTIPHQGGDPEELPVQELDTYFDPEVMSRVSELAKAAATIVAVASVVIWLSTVFEYVSFYEVSGLGFIGMLIYAIRSGGILIRGVFYYVMLRFVSEAGYILMDIEDRTRGSADGIPSGKSA